MAEELLFWIWRGLITLSLGGIVRLLLWQRRVDKELERIKTKQASVVKDHEILQELPLVLERDYAKKHDLPDRSDIVHNAKKVAVLEAHLAKLDVTEELKAVHQRVDEVAKSTAEHCGELKMINSNLKLIQSLLMGNKN